MRAVIIAGGLGTRLRPLTYNTPKPIVPVANRPFVLHQIELLRQHGITEIIINLHYLSSNIKKILGDGKAFGVKLFFSVEERPLGTAGAVKNAEQYFDDEPLVVFNGDALTDINIAQIVEYHKKKKARATLTLTRVADPTPYGLILTAKDGRVSNFIEKPSWEQVTRYSANGPADTINAGIYVLDPAVFKNVPKGVEYSFERQLFPGLLEKGEPLYGYISDRYWIDIGKPLQYLQAHQAIMRNEVAVRVSGSRIDGKLWVGDNARIAKSAKLIGPAIIGKAAAVGENVRVMDFTVIGDHVHVGADSQMEHTIIWEGTRIGEHVRLNGAIIGANCVIEDYAVLGEGIVLADNSVVKKGSLLHA
ncbi:MAG TPA: NDP-sugar synthase [Candidatus Sulfotelmatobacter sp.]|nr:NDP-sugar synthase [Candidatus Sulfotelmatobacter sp.]